jgi:UMP-CMP kinase
MVADMIKNGQIVPSRVTISLLEAAMADAVSARGGAPTTFLVDGFPRNAENRAAYEAQTGVEPAFILFFDCPESVMSARLAGRQQGRTDDNAATIAKRFAVFRADSMPVVEHYEALGKVRRVDADRGPDEVYADVRRLFL